MKERVGNKIVAVLVAMMIALTGTTGVFAADDPDITANGAILYCDNTDEILYSKNADEAFSPYSITKVWTAYLTVKYIDDLNREVTISEEAASKGGSSLGIMEGEVFTVEQLLYGALLPSGNDAAYALGEAVSGDNESFIELMNEEAAAIGCKNTHFQNSYGWQDDEHYTSAEDFLLLAQTAYNDPTVRKISSTLTYTIPATNMSEARKITGHLPLSNTKNSGIVYGKTGYWDEEDCSVMAAYDKDGLRLEFVLLNDTNPARKGDMLDLIEYGIANVDKYEAVKSGESRNTIWLKHGAKTRLTTEAGEAGHVYISKSKPMDVTTSVVINDGLEAPVNKGDTIGTIEIYVDKELTNTVPLVASESIKKGWFPSIFYISNLTTALIMAVIVLFVLLILILRTINKRRRLAKKRKRMEMEQRIRAREDAYRIRSGR